MGIKDSFASLFDNVNKTTPDNPETQEGIVTPLLEELTLEIEDEELLSLKKTWEKEYQAYTSNIDLEKRQMLNEGYWLGVQSSFGSNYQNMGSARSLTSLRPRAEKDKVDNVIFEAFETLLPIATREDPDPVVFIDGSQEGMDVSDKIRKMLMYLSDIRALKIKIKDAARHWGLYYIGVLKIGWDAIENEIDVNVIRPQKLVLDPNGTIEAGRFTGSYIGEIRRDKADILIKRFPAKKDYIQKKVKNKLSTELQYMEWWTNEYVFWTIEEEVLHKMRNPHWNYDEEIEETDEYGETRITDNPGRNHFSVPQMPYAFLSVFTVGRQPHDETSLIEQSRSMQDIVDDRTTQIEKNVDGMNGGLVFSSAISKEAATQAADALRRGAAIRLDVPDIRSAYVRDQAPPLPNQVFEDRIDARSQILNRFGVRGSTAQGIISERTVRGKYEIKGQDIDRIKLIVDYIEQMADYVMNWWVQMMFVYYDELHTGSVVGDANARQFFQLVKTDFQDMRITVSIKSGSMIPRDPLNKRNEAIDLWGSGALDPITLYDRIDVEDPIDATKKLIAWKTDPARFIQSIEGNGPQQDMQMGTQEQAMMPMPGMPEMPSPANTNVQQNVSPGPLPPIPNV